MPRLNGKLLTMSLKMVLNNKVVELLKSVVSSECSRVSEVMREIERDVTGQGLSHLTYICQQRLNTLAVECTGTQEPFISSLNDQLRK